MQNIGTSQFELRAWQEFVCLYGGGLFILQSEAGHIFGLKILAEKVFFNMIQNSSS